MRLAVFTNQFPATVSTFFARDVRALIDAGVDVEIFPIYPLDPNLWKFVPDILNEQVLPREKVHHLGTLQSILPGRGAALRKAPWTAKETIKITASAVRYGFRPLAYSLYVVPKAWKWGKEMERFDHIFAYWGNYSATCAYLASGMADRRVPFSIFLHAGTDLYRDRVFMRSKLMAAENIVTCSDFNHGYLLEQYPDLAAQIENKIHVYHHGLDFSELPYTEYDRASNLILSVGRLAEKKGFDYVIQAAAELARRGIDSQVELIGDGPEAKALQELASSLGIKDRVTFRGWVPFNQVREAMMKATILVHPSTGLGDGVPNVIKEAMALGLPVVSTHVAGIPEALDHGRAGLLVQPNDLSALADAIESLINDGNLRLQIARTANQHVKGKYDLWRNGKLLADRLMNSGKISAAADVYHPTAGRA